MRLDQAVSRDSDVASGALVFKGTTVPVQTLSDYLKSGETLERFLDDFPSVAREQAQAYLRITRNPDKAYDQRTADELVGRRVLHYEITETLGGGAMGVVYKARHTRLDRLVALKFLTPHLRADEAAKERFVHEAKAASALDHPNICAVYDIDETEEGRLFIAMAYHAGATLKKKIDAGPMPMVEVLKYVDQIAEGLGAAHAAGIIHRDVKPANIMITEGGSVKLVDFGLAKMEDVSLTRTGTTLGTVAYMSPEQASGQVVDHRTDLWSVGVVLYEMLTGRRPFRGEYGEAVLYSVLNDDPPAVRSLRPDVPARLSRTVEKLLQKDPAARYQQAGDVLMDLRAIGEENAAKSTAQRSSRWSVLSRRSGLAAGGMLLLVVMLTLLGRSLLSGGLGPIDAMAVLPLANLSGDPGQDYFADGMTEALIDNLGQIEALRRVISYTSVRQFMDDPKPVPEVGRMLNVPVVIEGSVRPIGDEVHVSVRLIDAVTEERLWSGDFARALRDVVALQREIAVAIATEIEVQVTPQEQARLADAREVDPRAMDRYLRGLNAWHTMEGDLHVQLPRARTYFEEAIAIDSNFARPYAALPVIYFMLEGGDGIERANRYARKALELDPSLSEAHVAMGICRTYAWDWKASEASFRRAIALNSNNSEAHRELGILMGRTARFEEAIVSLKRAAELAPLSEVTRWSLRNYGYYVARRFDELIEDARPDNAYYVLGLAYLHKGMISQARDAFMACCREDTLSMAYFHAKSGARAEALKLLREIEGANRDGERFVIGYRLAISYAALGDIDRALLSLDRATDVLPWGLGMVLTEPDLDPLRSDPRFQALAEEMGMDPWGRLR